MSSSPSVLRRLYNRIPRGIKRGIAIIAVYKGIQYITVSDKLYKAFSPSAHALGSTVLDLDLTSVEVISSDAKRSTSAFRSHEQISVPRLVNTLRTARDDPRVAGLVVRGVTGLRQIGVGEIAELRAAIQEFSAGCS